MAQCYGVLAEPGTPSSGGVMEQTSERRASRRFTMALPLTVRSTEPGGNERQAQTRDVSFRGLYFLIDEDFAPGTPVEFILTLPREITMASDVHIRCFAEIVRVEPNNDRRGVAARIDRYEFLPPAS
jgi:PilZ domain-containing protein